MKDNMTSQELKEMIADGRIVISKKGRLISKENPKMDYGDKKIVKIVVDPVEVKPVTFNSNKMNKRVKNATKVYVEDIKFDSKLEAYMYSLLKSKGVKMELQHVIVLQPSFKREGKTIRAIKWVADFYLPDHNLIIDTKGWGTEIFKMKLKIFKYLQFTGKYPEIKKLEFPSNKKTCLMLSVTLK
jgi:hypothetical protein